MNYEYRNRLAGILTVALLFHENCTFMRKEQGGQGTAWINPFWVVSRIPVLRDAVKAIWMHIRPTKWLALTSRCQRALPLPDKSGSNSPTTDGWKTWLTLARDPKQESICGSRSLWQLRYLDNWGTNIEPDVAVQMYEEYFVCDPAWKAKCVGETTAGRKEHWSGSRGTLCALVKDLQQLEGFQQADSFFARLTFQ